MDYDLLDVTRLKLDRATGRLEGIAGGKPFVREGVKNLWLKSVSLVEPDGTVHLNKGRVSIGENDAVAGD